MLLLTVQTLYPRQEEDTDESRTHVGICNDSIEMYEVEIMTTLANDPENLLNSEDADDEATCCA